jgi:dipeptidyl aminopeptidase/acylaminoacyl peptidase
MSTAMFGSNKQLGIAVLLALVLGCAAKARDSSDVSKTQAGAEGFVVLETVEHDDIVQMEVAYPSGDLTVRGFLFLPSGSGPGPAVVFNHGGVSGVSEDMKRRSHDLAGLGYVVMAPAYRGEGSSEGVVEVAKGEVDDVLAAAELLSHHPRVDAHRIAVTGSSHGALISVLAAAREPARFRCVVEASGVMDVVSWYRYLVENDFDVSDSLSVAVYGHGPDDKPEAFRIRQAIRVAGNIQAPVLLQQGGMDRTVPPEQARLMEKILREAGHDGVTLLEYPLLGHAFWFWNDPSYHTTEEIDQAEEAWRDFTAFLAVHLQEQ